MLKVTIHADRTERRLVVEGKLTGPWVSEFETAWKDARETGQECDFLIDVSGTTAIDASGKAALMVMAGEGARLIGRGVYTEHLVKELTERARENGSFRPGHDRTAGARSDADGLSTQASLCSPGKETKSK